MTMIIATVKHLTEDLRVEKITFSGLVNSCFKCPLRKYIVYPSTNTESGQKDSLINLLCKYRITRIKRNPNVLFVTLLMAQLRTRCFKDPVSQNVRNIRRKLTYRALSVSEFA
jgi:hypothetical protein